MFPVETLSATYMEDREATKKVVQQMPAATLKPASASSTTLQQPRPSFLTGMFSTLLVNQQTKSGASTPGSPFESRASTPLPSPAKVPTQGEIEAALLAEKKRDADICAMPAWYH